MSFEAWAVFVGVWLVAAATPGVNVAFTVATGLSTPLPRALLAPAGIGLCSLGYAALVSAGLHTLLMASAEAFLAVKWLGVAYLAWLGLRQWRAAAAPDAGAPPRPVGGARLLGRAIAVMAANPKAALAYGAVFPTFIAPGAPVLPQFAVLSLTSASVAVLVHCGYVLLARRLARWAARGGRRAGLGRATGGLYLAAAAALALVRRGAGAAG